MRHAIFTCLALAVILGLFAGLTGNTRAADEMPKFTIKQVMKQAHDDKTGLLGKVRDGKASKEEKEKLVELYTALAANEPPQGPAKSWAEKTKALIDAAKLALKDDESAPAKLKAAANCAGCHGTHRPKRN